MGKRIISSGHQIYLGVGVDIECISRFHAHASYSKGRSKDPFLKRIYTSRELSYCFKKGSKAACLAGRFTAKEAVRKALAPVLKENVNFTDVEILNSGKGIPCAVLKKSRWKNIFHISLSISHNHDTAIAVVVAQLIYGKQNH